MFVTKKQVECMINDAIRKTVEYLIKRCQTCGSGLINYKEFSPDGYPYYFCSKKCFSKWKKECGMVYRALDLRKVNINGNY